MMRLFGRLCASFALLGVAAACSQTVRADRSLIETAAVDVNAAEVVVIGPDWRPYFDDMSKGAIRVDLTERTLTYWAPGGREARVFPIAVPRTADFQRTGRTTIVRRREAPDWAPTPSMLERDPDLPRYVPPGPNNPLGEYALYLEWTYYAIHGTNDQTSIGKRATSGCFRLAAEDIEWLFLHAELGTPVLVEGGVDGPWGALPGPISAEPPAYVGAKANDLAAALPARN